MPIKSQEEFQNWLGQQSQKTCVLIASRAALRVYSVFTSERRLEHQHAELALVAARAILSAWVAATTRSPKVVQAARSAAYKATDSALIARPIALTIAVASSARSADTAINPKYSVANANRTIDAVREFDAWMGDEYVEKGYFAEDYAAGSEMVDATYKDAGIDPDFLVSTPLWHDLREPGLPFAAQETDDIPKNGSKWTFWNDWNQGFLTGKPLDWELQRRVALIDDDIWEIGLEAVAEEIERIRTRYVLEQEIENLKNQLLSSMSAETPAHRLHNQPPEAIDDKLPVIRKEITLVWDEIEDLEAEIAKPDPSSTKLKKIAQALWDISVRIGKYCGSVADIMIKETAKEFSKTGTKFAVAVITATTAAQNESIQSVAKAIWEFVKTLPPG